jgi:hypothetical protein
MVIFSSYVRRSLPFVSRFTSILMLEGSQLRLLNIRNGNDIIVPFCRLSLTRDSFVSATVREWNNLNLSVRNLDTL